jgi:hypothetical protein
MIEGNPFRLRTPVGIGSELPHQGDGKGEKEVIHREE